MEPRKPLEVAREEQYALNEFMAFRTVLNDFWVAGMVLQGILCLALVNRKAWKKFPVFMVYSVFNFAAAVVIYGLHIRVAGNRATYFYTYWICEAIGVVLGLAVVREIFNLLFSVHANLRRLATIAFRSVLVALLIIGTIVVISRPTTERNTITIAVLALEEAARIIEVGLLLTLFVFSTAFGLHWKQSVFGIASGLFIFVVVELIAVMTRSHMGQIAVQTFGLVRILAFDVSLLVWIGYMLAPERVTAGELPKATQLEQWNQAIMELIHQ